MRTHGLAQRVRWPLALSVAVPIAFSRPLRVAVASGKGGTGKTLVSTGLAVLAENAGNRVVLVDCDVEAPNDHLFIAVDSAASTPKGVRFRGSSAIGTHCYGVRGDVSRMWPVRSCLSRGRNPRRAETGG